MLMQLVLPIRFGKRVFIFCQSVGPFENCLSRLLFKWVISRVSACYLRESVCRKYFEQYGFDQSKIQIAADAAFYYSKSYEANNRATHEGLAIGITARPHKFATPDGKERYIGSLADYTSWAVTNLEAKVYLIPQVIGPSRVEDDRIALAEIFDRLPETVKKSVVTISDRCSPGELIDIYSKLSLLIGTRLHSIIFALCSGTKAVNIAYHGTKSQGILGEIGMSSSVIPIEDISLSSLIVETGSNINNSSITIHDLVNDKVALLEAAREDILSRS